MRYRERWRVHWWASISTGSGSTGPRADHGRRHADNAVRPGATARAGDYQPTSRQLLQGHLLMVGVGFWGGFIQIGVGFIIMPVLNRVMGLDLVRTNMHKVFIVAIYTVVALLIFAAQLQLLWLVGLALAAGNALGGYLGAHFTISKGERMIRLVLNLVLVAFIVKLLFDF
ncbi:MAG: sulfite exporter TauE/SafE family protein [Halioglobus sp.]